jgi:hypothetical protein
MIIKDKDRNYLQILERCPNQSEWFEIEHAGVPKDGNPVIFTKMMGYLYQWKEKNPACDYKIVLITETTLVIAD